MIFMLKEELLKLFNIDSESLDVNEIDKNLLASFDKYILSVLVEQTFSQEVLSVYRKFVSMKQEAPESMKNELFVTIRNFAKEQLSNGNFVESLVLYRFLLVKSEMISDDYSAIGEILGRHGEIDTAIQFMNLYEKKEENKPLMFITMANFYNMQIKDFKTAIKYYEKYLQIDKTKSVVYTIVANLYAKVYGDESLKDQIFYFTKAYALKPNDRLILHGLAFGYEKLGDKATAKKFYQELIKNNPTNIDLFNYGSFLISCGELQEGHKYFRHRFLIDDENLRYPIISDTEKIWDLKSDISDKILLVHYEQGFGDTFMYCRFVPELKKYASKIIFVVQDSLFDLIKNSPLISEGIDVVSEKDLSSITYDYSMALLDIPAVMGTDVSTIPLKDRYLEVSSEKINEYAKKYLKNIGNIKVAIAYSGDKNANYNGRDIDLNKFEILTGIKNIDLYSLQVGENSFNPKIISLGNTFKNFTDTASAIKNMDIVISTDNVILNLSGALGVRTFGLFNKQTNFRWFKLDGEDVGWYKSVKPLQVDYQDNWNYVFTKLINILTDYSKNIKK